MPQDEIDRLLVEHGARGQARRAAQGRRPVRVRPRRRGGAACCARPGIAVRGRAGRHRGRRGARLRRDPGHPPRARQRASRSSPGTRTREARLALDWAALAALPRHARLLHGRARAAADRRAAASPAGGRPTSRPRSSSAARCPASATVVAHARATSPSARRGGRPRAGDHGRRRRGRAARASSPGSSAGRCTGARSPSRARARRPARWPRGCASSAPTSIEAPAIRIEPLDAELPDLARLRPGLRDVAERRRRAAARRACATRARSPGVTRRGDRPGHGARAARARRSRPTSCPSAPSPRGWSRRSPTCRSRAR